MRASVVKLSLSFPELKKLKQEDQELKATLGSLVRSCLKTGSKERVRNIAKEQIPLL